MEENVLYYRRNDPDSVEELIAKEKAKHSEVRIVLADNYSLNGDYVIYSRKSNYTKMTRADVATILKDIFDACYETYKKFRADQKGSMMAITIAMGTKIQAKYNINSTEFMELNEYINSRFSEAREDNPETLMDGFEQLLSSLGKSESIINESINNFFPFNRFTENEVYFIIKNYLGENLVNENKSVIYRCLMSSKSMIEMALNEGIIEEDDFKRFLVEFIGYDRYIYNIITDNIKRYSYLLKYIKKSILINMYNDKLISRKTLSKYLSVKDLENEDIDKKIIMELFKKNIFNCDKKCLNCLWQMYENEFFTDEEINEIYNLGYLNINDIIAMYKESHNRQILAELEGIVKVSDENLVAFLSAEKVLDFEQAKHNEQSKHNEQAKVFFRSDLKEIYMKLGRDLDAEILQTQKEMKNKMIQANSR